MDANSSVDDDLEGSEVQYPDLWAVPIAFLTLIILLAIVVPADTIDLSLSIVAAFTGIVVGVYVLRGAIQTVVHVATGNSLTFVAQAGSLLPLEQRLKRSHILLSDTLQFLVVTAVCIVGIGILQKPLTVLAWAALSFNISLTILDLPELLAVYRLPPGSIIQLRRDSDEIAMIAYKHK